MKVRIGFVSNSSSCSFVLKSSLSKEDTEQVVNKCSCTLGEFIGVGLGGERLYMVDGFDWSLEAIEDNKNLEILGMHYEN